MSGPLRHRWLSFVLVLYKRGTISIVGCIESEVDLPDVIGDQSFVCTAHESVLTVEHARSQEE